MNPQADTGLYDRDFFEWAQQNAEILRRGCLHQADTEHIAEEIEGLAKQYQHAVENRLVVLIMHLLKWKLQPENRYSRSGRSSWLNTILEQRDRLTQLLNTSPSLRPFAARAVNRKYQRAVQRASAQTGIPIEQFPAECPFTFEQILDDNYLPS